MSHSEIWAWCAAAEAWRRVIRNTRQGQDKTRQNGSIEVDAEPKPNPGDELVVCACCANAGINVKVKIQP
jgi:hypothetical protein